MLGRKGWVSGLEMSLRASSKVTIWLLLRSEPGLGLKECGLGNLHDFRPRDPTSGRKSPAEGHAFGRYSFFLEPRWMVN